MGLYWRAAIAGLAVALGASTAAFAAVDATVRDADQLVRSNRSAEAYRLLAPLATTRAGDPDFDYVLGLAAVDSGRPAEAIIALQRVLALQPTNAQARAELARAYALAGDADTARREFDTVVGDPSLPDPVRQRFNGILSQLDRTISGGGTDLTGFVEASAGYDSNVNSATAQSSLVIPLFAGLGAASLSGSAVETSDSFGRLDAGASVIHGLSRQARVFGSVLGSVKENLDDDLFDQASLTGTGGYAYTTVSRKVISGSVQAQGFWLSGSRYRDSFGGTAQVTVPLAGGSALSLAGQYFKVKYPGDPLRDGDRFVGGASYAWRQGVVSLQAGKETTDDAAGDQFSNRFVGANASYEYPLSGAMTVVGSLGGEVRKYEAADPLFLATRKDEQIDAVLGLRVRVRERLILKPQVTYTSNASNIALYDYDRVTAAVTLRAEF